MVEDEIAAGTGSLFGPSVPHAAIMAMKTDDYILVGEQDRDAAYRWNLAKAIRELAKQGVSVQDRILRYLRENVGQPVTGEELRYVAKEATEWGRRTRELRTEEGWPVATKNSGRPDLPVSVYVLEADRQAEPHDRKIPDTVRVSVLERDGFRCRCCHWDPTWRKTGDPRALLELHHIEHHVAGGSNETDKVTIFVKRSGRFCPPFTYFAISEALLYPKALRKLHVIESSTTSVATTLRLSRATN
jgi:hypothetical protein